MYTKYTFQDWQNAGDKIGFLLQVINSYKTSWDFTHALEALSYYRGYNRAVMAKKILKADVVTYTDERGATKKVAKNKEITGNQLANGFFTHAVNQQCLYLLGNGAVLGNEEKKKLGIGFDKKLETIGRYAIIEGVCWGYWNLDHIEILKAAEDAWSGFVALLDERSSEPMVGIQFWQIDSGKPMYVRLFERDGITMLAQSGVSMSLSVIEEKRPYVLKKSFDAIGEETIGASNYDRLPVIPLFANDEKQSELTLPIKSKIDCYDRIVSDLGDNLDRANDVYWVLNNYSGTGDDVLALIKTMSELKAVVSQSGIGEGASTVDMKTLSVPYEARKAALDILMSQLYHDYMALDMSSIHGGSLTNVAIMAACADLNMKADLFEWQCFQFVQIVLKLVGVETEEIGFRRQTIGNTSETVKDIYMMRQDIDRRTALRLNPYINQDEIESIIQAVGEDSKEQADLDRLAIDNAIYSGESGL